jgi:hypothetical protein
VLNPSSITALPTGYPDPEGASRNQTLRPFPATTISLPPGGPGQRSVRTGFEAVVPGSPIEGTPQVAAVPEGTMSSTEHQSEPTAKPGQTDRPAGTVDEDANPPLTDPTETEPDRDQKTVPPQDTPPAVPPYEGRT